MVPAIFDQANEATLEPGVAMGLTVGSGGQEVNIFGGQEGPGNGDQGPASGFSGGQFGSFGFDAGEEEPAGLEMSRWGIELVDQRLDIVSQ